MEPEQLKPFLQIGYGVAAIALAKWQEILWREHGSCAAYEHGSRRA